MQQVTYQDYKTYTVRAAAILTNGFVAGTVLGGGLDLVEGQNQLVIYIAFTIGSLNDGRIKVEFSPDNTTWYQETEAATLTAGVLADTNVVHAYAAAGNYRISVPIKDRYIRISAIGTGTVTDSSMAITAVIGTA